MTPVPITVVGAYILNKKGEVLLIRSPKWGGLLVPPGGKIGYKEKILDALVREVKEETGLLVRHPIFLTPTDLIPPIQYQDKGIHFIGLEFRVEVEGENTVMLQKEEASEYLWLMPKDAIARDDIENTTRDIIEKYLVQNTLLCRFCDAREKEKQEYKTGWQRAVADYQNLKKEIEKMRGEWVQMSEVELLKELLPVYDNFKKALSFSSDVGEESKQIEGLKKGIGYIMKQLWNILSVHGVEAIETIGKPFDPMIHETIGEEEADAPSHTIVKEIEGGYRLRGKVIKPAKVVVAK